MNKGDSEFVTTPSEADDECIHEIVPASKCTICNPPSRSATARRFDLTRPMHLLLKWNPERGLDTLGRHLEVATRMGSTWWGCDTEGERTIAKDRLDRINGQLGTPIEVLAFLYRLGAGAKNAETWRATVLSVTLNESEIDAARRPQGLEDSEPFFFVEMSNFTRLPDGWALDHLNLWTTGQRVDEAGLHNQQSPMYVELRD